MNKYGIYKTFPKKDGDLEGGLRLQGIYKKDSQDMPLITYVTVVYNRVDTLLSCMESVWNQDYPNIEYIVIDGASTDGTTELIQKHADKIDYYISQPDSGIYNAMNKGVMLASGRFICFINSDDQCMQGAASKVIDFYRQTGADIICGSRELVQDGQRVYEVKYPRYNIKKSVFRYVQMFHQSTYVTKDVFEKVGYFEEEYSLLADWIWESKSLDAGFKVFFSDEELARFSYDGASCQGIYQRDYEWERWAKKTFPQISLKDVQFFIYCLDRGRHPLFDVKTLNKVAFRYFDIEDFRKTYYATILTACMEQCTDIRLLGQKHERYIAKQIQRYHLKEQFGIEKFEQLVSLIENKLFETYSDEITITKEMLECLIDIKRCLNRILYYVYMHKKQERGASKIDRLLRVMCYTTSKWAAGSVFLSRKFYTTLRIVWYYSFKGRFVEN